MRLCFYPGLVLLSRSISTSSRPFYYYTDLVSVLQEERVIVFIEDEKTLNVKKTEGLKIYFNNSMSTLVEMKRILSLVLVRNNLEEV